MSERKIFRTLMTLDQVRAALKSQIGVPLSDLEIRIEDSLRRILAEDITATIDVPPFDRATMDGFAVKAQDTFEANEAEPTRLKLIGRIEPGEDSNITVGKGEATEISTGAPLPVGANAVAMVEYTKISSGDVEIFRSVTPGENVMAAGSDIMAGELLLRRGQLVTSREVGILAALGKRSVRVYALPKVAIISTGNELVAPGSILGRAKIYDINGPTLEAAVRNSGGVPIMLGIAQDDERRISELLEEALKVADMVLTSGSTSAGRRDLLPKIISSLKKSKILANGLAVKPGKPAVVALVDRKPIFALPGNPTSALMVFHALVRPMIEGLTKMASQGDERVVEAQVAFKTFSVRGKQELLPVHVVTDELGNYLAYPALAGSGAITSFALADGFMKIPADRDLMIEGERVQVHLFSPEVRIADLVIIGSHCIGIDILLKMMSTDSQQISSKIINVGSLGGLHAVRRGEADLAGVHLLDESSGDYNRPFIRRLKLEEKVILIRGYSREQGLITMRDNPKRILDFEDLLRSDVTFINRNAGSGTRIIIDAALADVARRKALPIEQLTQRIEGYDLEAKSHSAVAAAILNGKVDVGLGIRTVAEQYGLNFIPHSHEKFDFAISKNRIHKNSVVLFLETLKSEEFKQALEKEAPGLSANDQTGNRIPLL